MTTTVPGGWRKSSRSGQETNCVELHSRGAVRDSKNPAGPQLAVGLAGLLGAVKADRVTREPPVT
jgi:hypothetical protein